MTGRGRVLAAVAALTAFSAVGGGGRTGFVAAATRQIRIWAAGDSYASGEGLTGIAVGEEKCQRATGADAGTHNPASMAWPTLVKEAFESRDVSAGRWDVGSFRFTACTGATSTTLDRDPTNMRESQLDELRRDADPAMFDVVTLSFGGNDVGFSDVIRNCIGINWQALKEHTLDLLKKASLADVMTRYATGWRAGCKVTEQELKDRIQQRLVKERRLADLYDKVSAHTNSGGLIVVTGYPQLFADPKLWSATEKLFNRCNRVSEGDVRMLRSATGTLNSTIGGQVRKARGRHPNQTWLFVDVSTAFEHDDFRASLCGNSVGINGLVYSLTREGQGDGKHVVSGFSRSYHPNQTGHGLYATAVLNAIVSSGWTPAGVRPDVAGGARSAPAPALCGNQAGRLVGGQLPDQFLVGMAEADPGLSPSVSIRDDLPILSADLDGDGTEEVVAPVLCTYPSVGYPQGENWLVVWSANFKLIGAVQVLDYPDSIEVDGRSVKLVAVRCDDSVLVCVTTGQMVNHLRVRDGRVVLETA